MTRARSRGCWSMCFSTPTVRRPRRSSSTSTPPTTRCTGIRACPGEGRGGALLPRLLRQLLLFAAVHLLRPAPVGGQAAPGQHRRQRRQSRGGGPDRRPDPPALAGGAHPRPSPGQALLRADSGFARDDLMAWCEHNAVDFLFGLARNNRLVGEIEAELAAAEADSQRTGKPARRFKDFLWSTRDSWSRRRRLVAKAEWTQGEANPPFVVTSLAREEHESRHLYERVYCARGEMENRIK